MRLGMSMRLAFICKNGRDTVKGRWKEWVEGKYVLEQMRVLTLIALECLVPLTLQPATFWKPLVQNLLSLEPRAS